jgi:endonuclease-8
LSSPQGRFADEAAELDGWVFHRAQAWGKHLLQEYRPPNVSSRSSRRQLVHIHLGIYGAFHELTVPPGPPVGQVRLRMVGHDAAVDLRGPNACERYTPEDLDDLIARLGPDPLRGDADPERARRAIQRSKRPIGALLMDQKVIAGIGNVYRAEVLFRAGIDPHRPGTSVSDEDFDAIWADLLALMPVGARRGQMHVVRPADDHGFPSYRPDRPRTYVYRRVGEPCRICGAPVAHEVMEGRNLFWCPSCQA